jgi:hypothetical protein
MSDDHGENREKVGPYHPPREYRWKPGQSGNPAGRPKSARIISDRITELLEATEIAGKKLPKGQKAADLVARKILELALRGNVAIIRELLDRMEGRVAGDDRGQQDDAAATLVKAVLQMQEDAKQYKRSLRDDDDSA